MGLYHNDNLKPKKDIPWGEELMDDNGKSAYIRDLGNLDPDDEDYVELTPEIAKDLDHDLFKGLLHTNKIFRKGEVDLYNKTYRFGLFNPADNLSTTREFLFFTKPDLHIFDRSEVTGGIYGGSRKLNPDLENIPYWMELYRARPKTIEALQLSSNRIDNFNHLLQNQVASNLEIPGLTATTIDTPTNMHGVGFSYRGTSEASDDGFEFSLEFKDTKWLDVYHFFKSYEEYETLKHHGSIRPARWYIENKVLHDQFAIYKFLVDEDMETIIYYAKFYGVMPKSLPRDVFSSPNFDNGITYSIDFKAAFFDDMRPEILDDFNALTADHCAALPYNIDIHNEILDRADNRPAKSAYIIRQVSELSPAKYVYKLKWKGSDEI